MQSDSDSRLAGAVLGSFAGDALALGVHWIYNPAKIERLHGRIADFVDPADNQYHGSRRIGAFSHYGDQTMELLRSLEPGDGYSQEGFQKRWVAMWEGYDGYVDGATKSTLETGSSDSNDLSGAGRIAPLLVALKDRPESELIAAAREQTAMTHGDAGVVEAAEFFALVARKLIEGESLDAALEAGCGLDFEVLEPGAVIAAARADLDGDTTEEMQKRGLDCHLPNAFPATLYLLLKHEHSLEDALIANTMAGGDSAARGLVLGMLSGAKLGVKAVPDRWAGGMLGSEEIRTWLQAHGCDAVQQIEPGTNRIEFENGRGEVLAARLEWPSGAHEKPRGVAIFAHCFTCSKDLPATTRISRALAKEGFAVLRFDFTGLGSSDGDFANENFSSNIGDLVAAAKHLKKAIGRGPDLLIGHSLGGAAVLAATRLLSDVRGVVTIGTPSDPGHVSHLFDGDLKEIEETGEAEVQLEGRKFRIRRQFLEDIREQNILSRLREFRGSLLVMHAPRDETVSIDHAAKIYSAAHHPKSFVSLAGADHLLTKPESASFAASMIAAWSGHLKLSVDAGE